MFFIISCKFLLLLMQFVYYFLQYFFIIFCNGFIIFYFNYFFLHKLEFTAKIFLARLYYLEFYREMWERVTNYGFTYVTKYRHFMKETIMDAFQAAGMRPYCLTSELHVSIEQ